jgi:hypothetical protein
MISSLFGKTRPVNYILVLSSVFVFFVLAQLHRGPDPVPQASWLWMLSGICCLLLTLFLVNFVIQRNQLTASDSYAMLAYALLTVLFQDSLRDPQVLIATLFLLLALRRLISMKSMKNLKEKVFDGALWIFVASLFVNWALLFVLLVWVYIYFYIPKKLNYWLIPIAAGVSVGLTSWSFFYLLGDTGDLFRHFTFVPEYSGITKLPAFSLFKLGGFLLLVITTGIIAFVKQGKSGQGRLTQLRLLVFVWILAVLVAFLTGQRAASAIMFGFFPSAVFLARYVESIRRGVLKNAVLYGVTLVSLMVFFMEWVAK